MNRRIHPAGAADVPGSGNGERRSRSFPFELLSLLGRGGQGGVFRARCTAPCGMGGVAPGDVVALKIMPVPADAADVLLARLKARMRAVGRLRSPVVVRHFGCLAAAAGPTGVVLVSVQEPVEGRLVSLILRESPAGRGPLEALEFARRLVGAFVEMEAARIAHCDVKPSNVVLSTGGTPRLLDFGLASVPGARRPVSGPGERSSGFRGAFDCMAPDFLRPFRPRLRFGGDSLSDLFSFCVLVHEFATGRKPFVEPGGGRRGYERRWSGPDPDAAVRIDAGALASVPGLADVLRRGLAPDRARRTPSFRVLREELGALGR